MVPLTCWLLALLDPAMAAPRFVADARDDAALAEAAWAAATACTGREGSATEVVTIVHRTIPGGWLGVAHTDQQGRLHRIDLGTEDARTAEVLVHEVGHAWISDGPVALVEGTAELLADCVAARLGGEAPLQWDDGRDLSGLPDLVAWTPAGEQEPNELGVIRTDAYLGAGRLLRAMAIVVPPSELWTDDHLDWEEVGAFLSAAGTRGAELQAALDGGGSGQRRALDDADRDGLPALAEAWAGTSDARFDTDGDGWWDGAAPPPTALAVPLDGTPVCTGLAAPAEGAGVRVVPGGNLRGADLPAIAARPGSRPRGWSAATGERPGPARLTYLPGGTSLLVQLDAPVPAATSGAVWAVVDAPALLTDRGCSSTAGWTVWAADPSLTSRVSGFTEALGPAITEASVRFGPATERLAVALGGSFTGLDGPIVWLAASDVAAATDALALTDLARQAVAARRLAATGERDWTTVQAVARSFAR